MKTIRMVALAVLLTTGLNSRPASAQAYNRAQGLARRLVPSPRQMPVPNQQRGPYTARQPYAQTPAPRPQTPPTPTQAPTPPPQPKYPAPTAPATVATAPMVSRPAAATDPERTQALSEGTVRKTIEFQKKRAEEGSSVAQYDLGMRYLKGDGLEKDEETGRKWLEKAAKEGNNQAVKKLKELDEVKSDEAKK